jgi:acyl-coenzyme A synthetase/AMP-(fatty) acid ligase
LSPPLSYAKIYLSVDDVDLSSVRNVISGGAPLGPEIIEAVYKRLGCEGVPFLVRPDLGSDPARHSPIVIVKMGSGMSEAGGTSAQDVHSWEELVPTLGSAGKPFPGVQFKIISTDGQDKRTRSSLFLTLRFLSTTPSFFAVFVLGLEGLLTDLNEWQGLELGKLARF